jgi:hypothetical protein
MHCLALGMLLAQAPPVKAVPATSTSKDMYSFWCTAERMQSILCQHHDLIAQMSRTTVDDEKKVISEKIKGLLKTASPPPAPGMPRPPSPFSKEYSQMKMAYCSSNPPGAKLMCSTAASQFKTAGSSSTKPSSATSSVTLSANEVWTWYCAKPKKTAEVEQLCSNNAKRTSLLDKLRTGGQSADARKALLDQLKLAPPPAYATTQALYTDFCKVADNAEKATCMRIKASQASTNMRNWYCARPDAATGDWCKRQAVLARMQKIPIISSPSSDADKALYEERKKLAAEYAEFSKQPLGGGPSKASTIAKEITAAKKLYCEQEATKALAYCTTPAPFTGLPTNRRLMTPGSAQPLKSLSGSFKMTARPGA